MSTVIEKKDQLIMSLVHYFVTIENYSPINVQGVKDEIWLENLEAPYKIIRINSKYIHNDEQFEIDEHKMEYVIRQIKKKTLSLKMNALNICLDVNERVKNSDNKIIESVRVNSINDVKKNKLLNEIFPSIKNKLFNKTDNIEMIIDVTNDINRKTEAENKKYERVFAPKKPIITKIIIGMCIALFLVPNIDIILANNRARVIDGHIYLLITSAFLHANIAHLLVNMYSLYIIGEQVETYFGKWRFLFIYIISALSGNLLSIVFNNGYSVGASGAIFGLLGCLLYFGYHYRLYLSSVLKNQIIPIILINLLIGFMDPNIDNACHIGGLLGGYLATMIVGVPEKKNNTERINGLIVLVLYVLFILYLLFR